MAAPLDPATTVLTAFSAFVFPANVPSLPESSVAPTLFTATDPAALQSIANIAYSFVPPAGLALLSAPTANVLLSFQEISQK